MKKVLGIIPAHNEAKNLPLLMSGFKAQTYLIDICIVSDNSTDNTFELSKELGATYSTETVGNVGMRSGAINWGLEHFSEGYDLVLAMDADSTCAPDMVEELVKAHESDPKVGAVCSRCGVLPQPELKSLEERLLWHLQHLEYGEYDSSRVETTNRIKVAHGLATMFKKEAIDQQISKHGHMYNIEALTEDYWLTMDLKEMGWRITSCQKARAWTIVPTRFKWLWKQRARWNLGGIDTIVAHGLNPITFWDVFAHLSSILMMLIEGFIMGVVVYLVATGEPIYLSGMFWLVFATVWINGMYRLRYCQNPSKMDVFLRIMAIPMELYYYFLMATLVNGYKQYLTKEKRSY